MQSTADTAVGPEISAGRGYTLSTTELLGDEKEGSRDPRMAESISGFEKSVRLMKNLCRTGALMNTCPASLSFSATWAAPPRPAPLGSPALLGRVLHARPGRGLRDAGSPDVKA